MLGQALALALFLVLAVPAAAEPLPGLTLSETAVVRAVVDGDTVRLADGRDVRLAAIATPRLPLPRAGAELRPDLGLETLAAAARQTLEEWTGEQPVDLYLATPHGDRHGRLVAHVVTPAQGWVQAGLVAQGLARVETPDGAAGAALVRLEATARAERRGLWDHPLFQVRAAEDCGRWLDTFQLVEGPVAAVRNGRGTTRLEIGTGERRLTVIVAAKPRTELRSAGLDLSALAGRRVRVRGWIRWHEGARVEINHAAAVELLAP